jgi:hypothetical protein
MDTIAKAITQEIKHVFDEDKSVKLQVQLNEAYQISLGPKEQFKR